MKYNMQHVLSVLLWPIRIKFRSNLTELNNISNIWYYKKVNIIHYKQKKNAHLQAILKSTSLTHELSISLRRYLRI